MTNRYNSWTALLSYNSNFSSLHSNNYQIQTIFFLKKRLKFVFYRCAFLLLFCWNTRVFIDPKKKHSKRFAMVIGRWKIDYHSKKQFRSEKKMVRAKAGATRINLTGEREMLITADSQVYLMTPIHLEKNGSRWNIEREIDWHSQVQSYEIHWNSHGKSVD